MTEPDKMQNEIELDELDERFKEMLKEVKDKRRFLSFLRFCVPRLQRCEQVQDIWSDWIRTSG